MDLCRRLIAIVVFGLLLAHSLAFAQAEDIVLAGKVVARIKDKGTCADIQERANRIDQRIAQAISVEDVGKPKMWAKQVNGLWTVGIGKTTLIECYPADASIYGKTTKQVAYQWVESFRALFPLSQPSIHMANPNAASEAARALAEAAKAAKQNEVPAKDWAIASVALGYMDKVRALPAKTAPIAEGREEPPALGYEDDKESIAIALISDVAWQRSNAATYPDQMRSGHTPGQCAKRDCPVCEAAKAAAIERRPEQCEQMMALIATTVAQPGAVQAVVNGFALARMLDEPTYVNRRVYLAYSLVGKIRPQLVRAEKMLADEAAATAARAPSGAAGPGPLASAP